MAKKIMKRSLALGALMAFVITGSAFAADVTSEVGKAYIGVSYGVASLPADANGPTGEQSLTDDEINIITNVEEGADETRAVWARGAGNKVILGNESSVISIKASAESTYNCYGIISQDNGKTVVNADRLSINVTAASSEADCYGIIAQQRTANPSGPNANSASVSVNANDIAVNSSDAGIVAMSNGQVDVNGNLVVNAPRALVARGYAVLNINTDGAHTTILNGDIDFNYDEETSRSEIDANVNVNFVGSESAFNGKAITSGNPPEDKGFVKGLKLQFNNGATWNLTGASIGNDISFTNGAKLVINGADFTENYAIKTDKLTMDSTSTLVIKNSTTDKTYKVVDGQNNISDANLSYDRTEWVAVEKETGSKYSVQFKTMADATPDQILGAQNKAITAAGGSALVAPNMVAAGIGPKAAAGSQALVSAITSSGASGSEMAQMFNDNANIGEEAGTSANAASVMNNVTGITTNRMSFTGVSTTPQGGHGKVERKYKSGAGVWAQYMHGKDKVDDMPTAGGTNSYESQYNGAVIGYDFKEVGKTHTGISFNYGEGDSHSKKSITSTRNDFDFWGVGLYHSIMNDDTNLIFDINYNKSDADVKQIIAGHEVTANPNTTSFSFGVRAEKLIQNGPVQIVPYVGARFLTIDTDDYKSSADYWYAPERQDIWLIPVGVSLRQENTYENGWKVTPKADLSYIWALGDTDSSTTVSSGAGSNPFEYTVMDNGSFLGTLGIEAAKGDWTYGLSYSYQKGEYQRSDKWFVDVRYSF
ncbi:MAG: autotransporter outer membrane beta-barrel domain-containing protein [Phascolarctobacterium sp.]